VPYPPSYVRGFDFTDWAEARPDEPLPGDRVDTELDNLQTALSGTQTALALIQRADGEIANETVGLEQLKPEVIGELANSIVADGEIGPAGPMGPSGPAGLVGPAGPSLPWILSTGVPNDAWGDLGQVYLNVDNGDVWQKSGGWILIGNIRGAAGPGGGGVSDHGALTGLTDPDHPIAAVQGLQAVLDGIGAQLAVLASNSLRTYRQASAPTANLNAGDLWVDTDDGNRLYRWDGVSWVDIADARTQLAISNAAAAIAAAAGAQAAADGKITTYVLPAAPAVPRLGDLWFESDAGNRLRRWNGTTWVDVTDASVASAILAAADAQATADGKVETYFQTTAPVIASLGDLWFDTDDNNHLYRYNGAQWVSARDALIQQAFANAAAAVATAATAQATADGNIDVFFQGSPPVGAQLGDLWIDTDDRQLYRWNGSAWSSMRDAGIVTALTDSALAVATADGKIRTFWQASPPVGASLGDLWFDTDNAARPYRWSGSAWQDVTPLDGVVGGLLTGVGIMNGTITAAKLIVTTLSAITADMGTLTAGLIRLTSGAFKLEIGVDAGYMQWAGTGDKNDANATFYLKPDGSAYFGGTLKANIVEAANLVPGAASSLVTAEATSAMSLSTSIENSLISASITTIAGTKVRIDVSVELGFPIAVGANGWASWVLRVYRNGTVIYGRPHPVTPVGTLNFWFIDDPGGAGTYTYEVRQFSASPAGSGQQVNTRNLILTELRR
jgi:hypothetical protein